MFFIVMPFFLFIPMKIIERLLLKTKANKIIGISLSCLIWIFIGLIPFMYFWGRDAESCVFIVIVTWPPILILPINYIYEKITKKGDKHV